MFEAIGLAHSWPVIYARCLREFMISKSFFDNFFLLSWQPILLLPLVHRQAVLVSRSICVVYFESRFLLGRGASGYLKLFSSFSVHVA